MLISAFRLAGDEPTRLNVAELFECGRQRIRNGRIVGGENAYEGEYPWAVSRAKECIITHK